ncbi:hypothetical protein Bca4012_033931 [Brassica carinata]
MIAMRFRGSAAAWWSPQKSSRAREGKPRILSWDKLKKTMQEYATEFIWLLRRLDVQYTDQQNVECFINGFRHQKMKDNLNLLNPLTLAEAHQKALIMEAQIKKEYEAAFFSYLGYCGVVVISFISLLASSSR